MRRYRSLLFGSIGLVAGLGGCAGTSPRLAGLGSGTRTEAPGSSRGLLARTFRPAPAADASAVAVAPDERREATGTAGGRTRAVAGRGEGGFPLPGSSLGTMSEKAGRYFPRFGRERTVEVAAPPQRDLWAESARDRLIERGQRDQLAQYDKTPPPTRPDAAWPPRSAATAVVDRNAPPAEAEGRDPVLPVALQIRPDPRPDGSRPQLAATPRLTAGLRPSAAGRPSVAPEADAPADPASTPASADPATPDWAIPSASTLPARRGGVEAEPDVVAASAEMTEGSSVTRVSNRTDLGPAPDPAPRLPEANPAPEAPVELLQTPTPPPPQAPAPEVAPPPPGAPLPGQAPPPRTTPRPRAESPEPPTPAPAPAPAPEPKPVAPATAAAPATAPQVQPAAPTPAPVPVPSPEPAPTPAPTANPPVDDEPAPKAPEPEVTTPAPATPSAPAPEAPTSNPAPAPTPAPGVLPSTQWAPAASPQAPSKVAPTKVAPQAKARPTLAARPLVSPLGAASLIASPQSAPAAPSHRKEKAKAPARPSAQSAGTSSPAGSKWHGLGLIAHFKKKWHAGPTQTPAMATAPAPRRAAASPQAPAPAPLAAAAPARVAPSKQAPAVAPSKQMPGVAPSGQLAGRDGASDAAGSSALADLRGGGLPDGLGQSLFPVASGNYAPAAGTMAGVGYDGNNPGRGAGAAAWTPGGMPPSARGDRDHAPQADATATGPTGASAAFAGVGDNPVVDTAPGVPGRDPGGAGSAGATGEERRPGAVAGPEAAPGASAASAGGARSGDAAAARADGRNCDPRDGRAVARTSHTGQVRTNAVAAAGGPLPPNYLNPVAYYQQVTTPSGALPATPYSLTPWPSYWGPAPGDPYQTITPRRPKLWSKLVDKFQGTKAGDGCPGDDPSCRCQCHGGHAHAAANEPRTRVPMPTPEVPGPTPGLTLTPLDAAAPPPPAIAP